MKITGLFKEFFESEKSSGLFLISCTLFSLVIANSAIANSYLHFWHANLAGNSLEYWINDGLMTIFFLLIGLELEREVYDGELSNIKDAMLPIFGAIGGMIVPAGLFLVMNFGTKTQSGAGIPMATDIAFALAILSLLGNKIPLSLKIFLTALAVIDDLGAILIIAVFYTKTLLWTNLCIALGIFGFLLILNRLKIRNLIPYLIGGVFMWYFMLHSGVHATITGVLLAFAIPFGNGDSRSTSYILQHFLHKPVAFFILPLFALANTAIVLSSNISETLIQNYSIGIALGLIIGKPLGIFLLSMLAVSLGICKLPDDLNWKSILAVGFLGGIGFTMSIFITLLAFNDDTIINNAKFVILISSLIAGIIGYFSLKYVLKNTIIENKN
ncbi:Na+/H+ antiporter NhaA [Flavobacterium psychrophilum]|uniref:Na(+)/H(+) antiporter NhaA n=2 Tax=Flavobacterium psychrophilum TaxID=96345 RepID=NHAA_FLAPJ|nr:Na+/H+ antiporter NhaA [Flavobacterium psychrophilum]A6H0G8.1 RecName: Full=Na(+)/H(+) antiporter NhaA; AltName: Full=Sodium/proton antiporter NhaA [Flavobacterium psychrophilum JIP02/86]AIG30527.1 pH-dependent sodium/proton antiporter [Flavobacterium psychrophilum]AIG32802.1 pH-dependent sodium/proton antiporter [Flavobacterium psychrophilum]AIG34957.1 pH-dependent sodium/proton antiporter [Flavobacterium psychrophilum]AIG37322.1 pH-dependent sodium/proton antiporter [Flavobacterium psychr